MPINLTVDAALQDVVARMVRRSPTFRRQCARIDQTRNLIVRMREDGPRGERAYSARTVIRRHQYGAIVAHVRLYSPFDAAEIIAHEFEHLLEQIDGVNLRLLSLIAGSGVTETNDGSYETRRAVLAGRRVASECASFDESSLAVEATY